MLREFTRFIESYGLIRKDERILLAVSGGPDSMVMTHLFMQAGYEIGIAHCNFGLRGAESDQDEQFVREFSMEHGLPFYQQRFETKKYADDQGISLQMAARDLRYEWFGEVRAREGFNSIATAHHKDDVVETFIINLTRGTGISGLRGIPVQSGRVIRPILFAWRDEIEKYASEHKITFRLDRSNDEIYYTRNRIRHEIIPALEQISPSFRAGLVETAEKMRETEKVYRELIEVISNRVIRKEGDEQRLSIREIRSMNPNRTLIFELLRSFGVTGDMAGNILASLDGIPGKTFETPTHRLLVDRDDIIVVMKGSDSDTSKSFLIAEGTEQISDPVTMHFLAKEPGELKISDDPGTAFIDRDKISFPLILRRWEQGDTFIPLGMSGTKKLSNFFVDEKMSRFDKENTWLLCSGKDIVWVVGHRIDDRFKITGNTRNILVIITE